MSFCTLCFVFKVNNAFCLTAYTTFLNGHALLFQVCPIKQKNLLMKYAPGHTLSVLKTCFFCCKVEVCCERAISFSIEVIWRVTNNQTSEFLLVRL